MGGQPKANAAAEERSPHSDGNQGCPERNLLGLSGAPYISLNRGKSGRDSGSVAKFVFVSIRERLVD
jgi:hypothetical protein